MSVTVSWAAARARRGRNELPSILADVWASLSLADLADAIGDAWTGAEWPEQHLTPESWVMLLDTVGYLVDGSPARREDDLPEVVTLYRGAIPGRREGMSWTTNLDTARWFAHRFDGVRLGSGPAQVGQVWRIDIPRDYVLARFNHRNESEHVVDVSDFDPAEYRLVE